VNLTGRDALPAFHRTRGGHCAVWALVMACTISAFSQDQVQTSIADLQKEASTWQQKIKDMQERIAKTDVSTADAVKAFRTYLRTEAAHKAEFQAQNDSLALDIAAAKRRVDSLEQSAENRKLSGFAADNRVEEMRLTLIAACGDLNKFYASLPPSNIRATATTLDFLKSELESKSVTVSEALERFWQILGVLADAETSMDTYMAPTPVAGVAGQVYFVRVGLAYCAIVSEEGTTAYLWVPGSQSEGAWQPVTDMFAKAALWDAVRIRDRKIVPRIVELPFSHPLTLRNADKSDNNEKGRDQ
jgi:hypothetical protein